MLYVKFSLIALFERQPFHLCPRTLAVRAV